MMKTYTGRRDKKRNCVVHVIEDGDSRLLPPRLDIENKSPTGFEWGYAGSGPAQLAIAILADAMGDAIARKFYQKFKFKVIAHLPRTEPWQLTEMQVFEVVGRLMIGAKEENQP